MFFKKYSSSFYLSATFISLITIIYEICKMILGVKINGFFSGIESLIMKGNISIVFIFMVMFAGALNPKWEITKKLLRNRSEFAILGCILLFPHIIIYLIYCLKSILIYKYTSTIFISYLIVGTIAFLIMIPLFITSFKKVRNNMSSVIWKKIQRWSYLFYFLVYNCVVYLFFK